MQAWLNLEFNIILELCFICQWSSPHSLCFLIFQVLVYLFVLWPVNSVSIFPFFFLREGGREREINTSSFPIWFIFVHLLDIYSSRVGKQHGALPSVIVIGGGISGIAAARMLQNASFKVFIPSKWYFMSDCVFISFPSDNVFLFYSGNLVGITR